MGNRVEFRVAASYFVGLSHLAAGVGRGSKEPVTQVRELRIQAQHLQNTHTVNDTSSEEPGVVDLMMLLPERVSS